MAKVIDAHSTVTLHFSLSLADGTLAETTYTRQSPAQLTMGDGNLPSNFENCLLGLKAGDKKRFELPCAQAFGDVDMDKMHSVPRSQFTMEAEQPLTQGVVMGFDMPNGQQVAGVIHKIDDDAVVVDFNYPLAGHDVVFEVDIVDVV